MAKLRHIAIKTKSPQKLAKFYEDVFDLKVMHTDATGAIFMTDGYFNLALLKNRGDGTPSGINHFGFEIESLPEIEQRLKAYDEPVTGRAVEREFAEKRTMDPDGNQIDLSEHGFLSRETAADRAKKRKEPAKV